MMLWAALFPRVVLTWSISFYLSTAKDLFDQYSIPRSGNPGLNTTHVSPSVQENPIPSIFPRLD